MKIVCLAILALLAMPQRARAQTTLMNENFDTYTSGLAPPAPWFSVSNTPVTNLFFVSSPNGAILGNSGNASSASYPLGATYNSLNVAFAIRAASPSIVAGYQISVGTSTGLNSYPRVNIGDTNSPPAGS
jgi:hypothetical protein